MSRSPGSSGCQCGNGEKKGASLHRRTPADRGQDASDRDACEKVTDACEGLSKLRWRQRCRYVHTSRFCSRSMHGIHRGRRVAMAAEQDNLGWLQFLRGRCRRVHVQSEWNEQSANHETDSDCVIFLVPDYWNVDGRSTGSSRVRAAPSAPESGSSCQSTFISAVAPRRPRESPRLRGNRGSERVVQSGSLFLLIGRLACVHIRSITRRHYQSNNFMTQAIERHGPDILGTTVYQCPCRTREPVRPSRSPHICIAARFRRRRPAFRSERTERACVLRHGWRHRLASLERRPRRGPRLRNHA